MQRILMLDQIQEVEPFLDADVIRYIARGDLHTFESFGEFDIVAFEWSDSACKRAQCAQVLAYLDKEDFFVFCKDASSMQRAATLFHEKESAEQAFADFFSHLFKDNPADLDELEDRITQTDDDILLNYKKSHLKDIIDFRRELLGLKRYYEQFVTIFEDAADNENGLFGRDAVRRLNILANRARRLVADIVTMQDRISQMREAYQAQIDIEQNQIMKVFTTVTVIFLPLTLLVGWYGMNLQMPEYHWPLSYPVVIIASVLVGVGLYFYFKRKKWI